MNYRATPLSNGYNPTELLFGRKIQTQLPIQSCNLIPRRPNRSKLALSERNSKTKQKQNYDRRRRRKNLSKLQSNDKVWITDQNKHGVIKSEHETPRSYVVITKEGDIRRNRKHLIPEPVYTRNETTLDSNPVRNNQNMNSGISANTNDSQDAQGYRTRSGRLSKPPGRLNL